MCEVTFDPPVLNKNGGWHTARIVFEGRPRVLRWMGNDRIKYQEFYPSKDELEQGWMEKRLFIDSFPNLKVVVREMSPDELHMARLRQEKRIQD